LGKQRVKVLLEIAFISDDSPELAGFPSLFDRIKCRVVKETVDMPVWIAQAVYRPGIPVKEFRIQQLARSTILLKPSLPDLAPHLGFDRAHCFIHCRPCDILNHLVACDRQIDAERLWNSEHKSIANLPVADLFAVRLPAFVCACRQSLTRGWIFVSQQCYELRPLHRTT
jgi:hypothetical protein